MCFHIDTVVRSEASAIRSMARVSDEYCGIRLRPEFYTTSPASMTRAGLSQLLEFATFTSPSGV